MGIRLPDGSTLRQRVKLPVLVGGTLGVIILIWALTGGLGGDDEEEAAPTTTSTIVSDASDASDEAGDAGSEPTETAAADSDDATSSPNTTAAPRLANVGIEITDIVYEPSGAVHSVRLTFAGDGQALQEAVETASWKLNLSGQLAERGIYASIGHRSELHPRGAGESSAVETSFGDEIDGAAISGRWADPATYELTLTMPGDEGAMVAFEVFINTEVIEDGESVYYDGLPAIWRS